MIKERRVTEKYTVCDYCNEEIDDYSSTSLESTIGLPTKHFHSMRVGGSKGKVKKTCFDLFKEKRLEDEGLDHRADK